MKRFFVALFCLLWSTSAEAKGEGGGISGFCFGQDKLAATVVRFPEGQPDMVVVSTNFGILVSRDGGETFGWICPETYGAQIAGNFTLFALPGVAVLPDGTLFVLTGNLGYWISGANACDFESAPDEDLRAAAVVSVAARSAVPETVFAAASWPGRGPFGIFRSDDDGATFAPTAFSSDGRLRFGSVYLTPGAERVYTATRTEDGVVSIWRSDDQGDVWTAGTGSMVAASATIAGTRSTAIDEVYLEVVEAITGVCDFDVALMRSTNAGDTFELVRQREGDIPVGSIIRDDGAIWMAWKDSGIEVVDAAGGTTPLDGAPAPLGCMMAARGANVAVCPIDAEELVSIRDDATGEFAPLVTLDRITGPLDCPADTDVGRSCGEAWEAFATYWGLIEVGPDPDGGVVGEDGGVVDPDRDAAAGLDAGTVVVPGEDGCTCHTGAPGSSPHLGLLAALGFFLFRRSRRGPFN